MVKVRRMRQGEEKIFSSKLILTINSNQRADLKFGKDFCDFVEAVAYRMDDFLLLKDYDGTILDIPLEASLIGEADVSFNIEIGPQTGFLHAHYVIETKQRVGMVQINVDTNRGIRGFYIKTFGYCPKVHVDVDKGHSEYSRNYLKK